MVWIDHTMVPIQAYITKAGKRKHDETVD